MIAVDNPMITKQPHTGPCGAKTRNGSPCQHAPMLNGRCHLHGGRTPKGVAVASFKDGRYSKYLPNRLIARYQEAAADTELLNLREDVALIDARIADLLGRVDSGESAGAWKRARETWRAYSRCAIEEKQRLQAELDDLLSVGLSDAQGWEELAKLLQDRRRLVESERKRLVEMQQTITTEQAMVLLAAVVDTVRRHVTDRNALAAISSDIARLTGAGTQRPAQSV